MERLTERDEKGNAYYPHCFRKDTCDGMGGDCGECNFSQEVCERLAAYEDTELTPAQLKTIDELYTQQAKELGEYKRAEEQGVLVKFPCKIGDDVWAIRKYKGIIHVQEGKVHEMFFTRDMKLMIVVKHVCRGFFGEKVFLTKEEAEAKLKELNMAAGHMTQAEREEFFEEESNG